MATRSKTVEHVGEWKIEVSAETLEDVFAETARVIAEAAGTLRGDEPGPWEHVRVSGSSLTSLLADWANELLGRSETEQRAYADVRNVAVSVAPTYATISAEVRGTPVREWLSPLKAATYHGLQLEPQGSGWRGVILFDV
ncbi:MAG: archease [Gemmatimonadota bacterium]